MLTDTICAISTALGETAISILRVSGEDALEIVSKIFTKNLKNVQSHTITYGYIKNPQTGEYIDEVLVSVFLPPRSYTRENVVEINCHGGILASKLILELLLTYGCRLAEPGEFTKRAFLNGRIDMTQAEAVMDIISSKTENSLKLANNTLRGSVEHMITGLINDLTDVITQIEVNIDYPEYEDIEQMTQEELLPKMEFITKRMEKILEESKTGKLIREGIKTAIVGKPNVGKSSLLNLLLEEEKAIVTNIPGTTRDVVEGNLSIKGTLIQLLDTAGIHKTEDTVEQIGIEKSIKTMEDADLVLLLLDASNPLSEEDLELLNQSNDKTRIVIYNKSDLPRKAKEIEGALYISTKTRLGIEELENKILDISGTRNLSQANLNFLSNARQIGKMNQSYHKMLDCIESIHQGISIDICELDLREAWTDLKDILGTSTNEDLVNEIFKRFCLGK